MVQPKQNRPAWVVAITASFGLAFPVHAQAPLDSEALITPALRPDSGIALARQQIADNDLLGAASTLERVIITNRDSVEARLLYASLLCRLDDREGAAVEINLVGKRPVPDASWSEVISACGELPRPAAGRVQ